MKSRKEIIIILLFVLIFGWSIAGSKYNVSHLVNDWVLADLGETHMTAVRVLEGQVPYDDYDYGYGPYAVYFHALLFKLFGIRMSVPKMAMTLAVIVITGATYLLGRKFLPMFQAFLAAVIVHLTLILNTLVPYPNVYSIAIGLIALLLVCRYCRTGRERLVFLAGILCGVSLCLKLVAGLFTSAGVAMALMVADGQYTSFRDKASERFSILSLRLFIVILLIACSIALIWRYLSVEYLLLFVLPVVIACLAALKVQGRFKNQIDCSQRSRPGFELSFFYLIAGAVVGIIPGLYIYLFKADWTRFFHNLIGFATGFRDNIFLGYPEMDRTVGYLLACSITFWLTAQLAKRGRLARSFWLVTLLMTAACIWLFRSYFHLTSAFSLFSLTHNIILFLGPVVSIATGILVLLNSEPKSKRCSILEEDSGIIIILVYQAFSILSAFPRADFVHVSWSLPTTMILLMFLLEKGRVFIVDNWPRSSRRIIGRMVGSTLTLSLPVLIIASMSFSLLTAFYTFSPDMLEWKRKQYLKLNNERADIYEFIDSAYQIEAVDRFIQTNTNIDDCIFEFPTSFFYFYSQRKSPTRWLYYYPGLYSSRQDEIIADLERTKPGFTVIYDNPKAWLFSYSNPEIQQEFQELIEYIDGHYDPERRIGYFTILKRKMGD